MITEDKVFHFVQGTPEIFCIADDFCKYFSSELKKTSAQLWEGPPQQAVDYPKLK
ncbi:MAG: hypothetical protein K2L05_06945 [Muribaculaceae bacterium]|nr:hypothetical protein [Muribaculaceae bacterium]